jgi:hypothetical protein
MTMKAAVTIAIAVLVGVFAFVGAAAAADDAKHANIKTIGVIAALGDTLYNVRVGSTAFGNARDTMDVADWKLDAFVTAETTQLLSGRFEIKPVTYDRADFTPKPSEWRGWSELDVEDVIGRAKPSDGVAVDAYLVVHNQILNDMFAVTNQRFYAAGLHHRSGLFGDTMQGIFVAAMVVLVDARTRKEIDRSVLVVPGGESLFSNTTPANRKLKGDLWTEDFVMTPEQREQAHQEFKSLIREALATSLPRVDLLPKK